MPTSASWRGPRWKVGSGRAACSGVLTASFTALHSRAACSCGADPDYDSGLVDMSLGVSSFKELSHNLGVVPENVQVFVTPKTGSLMCTCLCPAALLLE
jgi:hypothetical protein